jgi:hypothetical protein
MLENNSGLSDRPYSEASEEALQYADRLDRRNEKIVAVAKASSIIDRYISSRLNIRDDEDREELAGLRSVKRKLAGAGAKSARSFAKLSGRTYGKPEDAGAHWDTQREIDDPNDEAGEGVAGIADHYGVGNFYRMLADDLEHDGPGLSLANCGKHLLAAKLAHVADDHDGCERHLGKAMTHFAAFHKALKKGLAP